MIDWLKQLHKDLAARLDPDETALAMMPVALDPERDPTPPGRNGRTHRIEVPGVAGPGDTEGTDGMLGPSTLVGGAGRSQAEQLLDALRGSDFDQIVVTDRRVLFVDGATAGMDGGLAVRAEVSRDAVAGARRNTGLTGRSRFELMFEDGSGLPLVTRGVTGGRAKVFVGVLGHPVFQRTETGAMWARFALTVLSALSVLFSITIAVLSYAGSHGMFCSVR